MKLFICLFLSLLSFNTLADCSPKNLKRALDIINEGVAYSELCLATDVCGFFFKWYEEDQNLNFDSCLHKKSRTKLEKKLEDQMLKILVNIQKIQAKGDL